MTQDIYTKGLAQNAANFVPLSPISFLERSALIYSDQISLVADGIRHTWAQTHARCRRLASALQQRGIRPGDTVSIIAPNVPAMFEAHFGVPMSGAVLNAMNTRLDAKTIAFILEHAETKLFLVDHEFETVVREALEINGMSTDMVIDIDPEIDVETNPIGAISYEAFLETGTADFRRNAPIDEWDAISLNYTSGTTGNPKGVVYHHRGAHINSMANIAMWELNSSHNYLWTLPMFHCNGWCYPWTIAATGATAICLRAVRPDKILDLMKNERVTHFCGPSIIYSLLLAAPGELREGLPRGIKTLTGGAPPPSVVLEDMEKLGFEVTHGYGLTESYGPAVVCTWKPEWDSLTQTERAQMKARQGVRNHASEDLMVANPETQKPVPSDGETIGEVFIRGNNVMKGYLKNPSATEEAFKGGWLATGDLGVLHPNGYLELRDRAKDIIISGGENISSIEVEDILHRHPKIADVAVVARAHEKWGESPCAFVTLAPDQELTEQEVIAYCRDNMAHFKAPTSVIFGPLPKTSTGKTQKFELRKQLAE